VLLPCSEQGSIRVTQIVPTSGLTSISLWDAPDLEALREWCVLIGSRERAQLHRLRVQDYRRDCVAGG
jgi:hypothetical protein